MDEFKAKQLNKEKMVCPKCFFIYDPLYGDPESNIDAFTNFTEMPEEWTCPICGERKELFVPFTKELIFNEIQK